MKPFSVIRSGHDNLGHYKKEAIVVDVSVVNGILVYRGAVKTVYVDDDIKQYLRDSGCDGWSLSANIVFPEYAGIAPYTGEFPKRSEFANVNWETSWAREFFKQ